MLRDKELEKAEIVLPLVDVISRLGIYSSSIIDEAMLDLRQMYVEGGREGEITIVEELIPILLKFKQVF